MRKLFSLLILLSMLAAPMAMRAEDAFGMWFSVDAKKKLPARFSVDAGAEFRTLSGQAERFTLSLSGAWAPLNFLKVDVGYKFLDIHYADDSYKDGKWTDGFWNRRHRLTASVTGSYRFWMLKLSLRERYQFTHREGATIARYVDEGHTVERESYEMDAKDKNLLRSRLQAELKLGKRCPFTPFASAELFSNLNDGFGCEKWRFTVGTEYKLNKHSEFELYYVHQNVKDLEDLDTNAVGIGYTYTF